MGVGGNLPACVSGRVMAQDKGQSGARREPVFDSGPELRVAAGDRRREAAPANRRTKRKRARKSTRARRSLIGRAVYWSLVLGLWLVIGAAGTIAWTGAHLPPIQSLEIPKRPPSIQIVDVQRPPARHPRRQWRRRAAAEGTAELRAESLHRHRGSALLRALRRRSLGHRARRWSPTFCTAA